MTEPCGEDIIEWPDGTWCYRDELPSMTHMSDDYKVIPFDSPEYHAHEGSGP